MFKHVEMQKGAHFTIVCTILLIRLGSKIQENFAKQHVPGAPNGNFRKISVRKTIWDLEFSEHLL